MNKKKKRTYITDHALMRYMQRVHNINVEKYREEMHSDEIEAMVKAGAQTVKIDGFTFICKEGRIVTTYEGRTVKGRGLKNPRKRRRNDKRSGGGTHRSNKRRAKAFRKE